MRLLAGKRKWLLLPILAVLLFAALLVFNNGDEVTISRADGFSFVVMADSQGSSSGVNEVVLRAITDSIKDLPNQPRFILFGGDMAHGNSSDLPRELERWKRIMQGYTYYPAMGNHERSESIFSSSFRYLPNDQLRGYGRTAYYFDYGNARFIVLNSIRRDDSRSYVVDSNQRAWLESLLRNSQQTHCFVMFHVPAYPAGRHYGNALDRNPGERDALWAILDRYNVTAVFNGHEHYYNRRLVDSSFSSGRHIFNNEIYQITTGGAGAPLDSGVRDDRNIVAGPISTHHYVAVDVRGRTASFNVYDVHNRLIDSFRVSR